MAVFELAIWGFGVVSDKTVMIDTKAYRLGGYFLSDSGGWVISLDARPGWRAGFEAECTEDLVPYRHIQGLLDEYDKAGYWDWSAPGLRVRTLGPAIDAVLVDDRDSPSIRFANAWVIRVVDRRPRPSFVKEWRKINLATTICPLISLGKIANDYAFKAPRIRSTSLLSL